jgi:heat-inducible transcriptional repressor
MKELQELLSQTSRILSGLSQYSGFVLTPKVEKNLLQYLELIQLSERQVLAIIVTHTGQVKHTMIEARISREKLQELNRFMNARLRGISLAEAKKNIVEAIHEAERQERDYIELAQNLGREMFEMEEQLFLDGTSNVLTLPEFHDYEPMRSLLRLSEDKDLLMHLLNEDLDRDGVRVHIGLESSLQEFRDLSIVSSVYKDGDTPVGVLGIIGPKRMEYPRMMALVGAVSQIVNKILSRKGG